jgi:hypothetical protein
MFEASKIEFVAGLPPAKALKSGERGAVDIKNKGDGIAIEVFLSKKADITTVQHELAHAYYRMIRELAAKGTESAVKELAAINEWTGAQGEPTTEQEEMLAEGFEKYLSEGKSPSYAMASVFMAIRQWAMGVYQRLLRQNVKLDDNIRRAFDRMLATESEMQAFQDMVGQNILPAKAEDIGITQAEYDRLVAAQNKTKSKTWTAVRALMNKARSAGIDAAIKAEVAFQTERYGKEYDELPQSKALAKIKTDKEFGKLDIKLVNAIIKANPELEPVLLSLRRGTRKKGMIPDDIAKSFGFDDAVSMFKAMIETANKDAWVANKVESHMRERSELLGSKSSEMKSELDDMLADMSMEEAIERFEILTKGVKAPQYPSYVKIAKSEAARFVAKTQYKDIDPKRWLTAAGKMSREALSAMSNGRRDTAAKKERKRILFLAIYQEQRKAQQLMRGFNSYAVVSKKPANLAKLGKAERFAESIGYPDWKFREMVEILLWRLGYMKPQRAPTIDLISSLEKMNGVLLGANDIEAVSTGLRAANGNPGALTVEQLIQVDAVLRDLRETASRVNRVRLAEQENTLEEVAETITKDMKLRRDAPPFDDKTLSGKLRLQWQGSMARSQQPLTLLRKLGSTGARIEKALVDAFVEESKLTEEINATITPAAEALADKLQGTRGQKLKDLAGVPLSPQRRAVVQDAMWMVMVAQNMLNESNISRLETNENWNRERVRLWLYRNLTQEMHDFLVAMSKANNMMRDKVDAVHKRLSGSPMRLVEPAPLITRFGEIPGSYFPIVYDPLETTTETDPERQQFRKGAISVPHPFTNNRASSVKGQRLLFSPQAIARSFLTRIRFVSSAELVSETNKILSHPLVAAAIREKMTEAEYQNLVGEKGWLHSYSNPNADRLAEIDSNLEILGSLGAAFTSSVVGNSLRLMRGDFISPITYALRSQGKLPLDEIITMTLNPATYVAMGQAHTEAMEESALVRERNKMSDRRLRQIIDEIDASGFEVASRKGEEKAMWLQDISDRNATTIVYTVARDKALRDGMTQEEAVRYAEEVMISVLPPLDISLKSRLLRDKTSRLLGAVMFQGWFNNFRAINARALDAALMEYRKLSVAGDVSGARFALMKDAAYMSMAFLNASLVVSLLQRDEPEDTGELSEWAKWSLKMGILFGSAMYAPIAGPIVTATAFAAYEAISGEKLSQTWAKEPPYIVVTKRVYDKVKTIGDSTEESILSVLYAASLLPPLRPIGTPLVQISTPGALEIPDAGTSARGLGELISDVDRLIIKGPEQ